MNAEYISHPALCIVHFALRTGYFEFVSNFVLRISDLIFSFGFRASNLEFDFPSLVTIYDLQFTALKSLVARHGLQACH